MKGVKRGYFLRVFETGKEGYWVDRRGGHNVTDGASNLLRILNDFCKLNPDKCQEMKLKKIKK